MQVSKKPESQTARFPGIPESPAEELRSPAQQKPDEASHTPRQFPHLFTRVILPFLVIRLLLVVVGMVTIYYVYPLINRNQPIYPGTQLAHFPDMLWLMWNHYDSGFYLNIAHDGYWGANTLHSPSNWAFFPLYPLLIHLVALPFGSSMEVYNLVGLAISNSAALVAAVYLYQLTARELNHAVAARAVFYLAIFPMNLYLSAIYPESLFLALAISSIYYARVQRWWLAGLLGCLAALTRPSGVVLAVAIGWEYWQVLADRYAPCHPAQEGMLDRVGGWLLSRFTGLWRALSAWSTWSGFAALALVPAGLLLFLLYAQWKVGTYQAYFLTEKYGWYRSFSNPVLLVLHALHHPAHANPYDWNFYALNIVSILFCSVLLVPVFRKLPAIYGILMAALLVMPLMTGKLDSTARYYITLFPIYMLLAWWSCRGTQEQQIRRHSLIAIPFAIMLSVGMVLFTLGVYSMA